MTLSGVLIYGACYGVFISVLPGHLILAQGFSPVSVGIFFALFYLSVSLSQLIVGPLSDRFGRHQYMVAGLVMVATGLATFVHIPYPWVFLPLILASLGLGVFCVSSLTHLNECAPADLKASISGSYYLAWGFGYFLGPVVLGYLDEHVDSSLGYDLLALACAIQALQLWTARSARCASSSRGS
jgi:MFS family permease